VGFFRKLFGPGPADDPAGLIERGTAEYRRGEYDKAVATLTRALELGPPVAGALIGRGQALLDLGREPAARADFQAALGLNRAAVRGHFFWRGQTLGERGRRDEEIAAYTYALGLDPGFSLGYAARGNAYREAGDYPRALVDCDAALRFGDEAALYSTRGLVHHGQGSFGRAVADFTEAIRREPNNAVYYENRAAAYRGAGDEANAAADEERVRLVAGDG
jgi:tetratricopeptide (TPR) repeat protein